MTFEELVSELRGYVAEAKREDGAIWADTEIRVRADQLEVLLDEAEKVPA